MSLILAFLLIVAQDKPTEPQAPSADAPVAGVTTPARPCTPSGRTPSRRIAELVASADGATRATAIRVRSIGEEYEILDALGLCPNIQALMMPDGHPYDVLYAIDSRTGAERALWFDISSFFGQGF